MKIRFHCRSVFLLLSHIGNIGVNRLIQLLMDGPNVNRALFDKLEKDMEAECEVKLVNIGSCGLHIVHNVFKAGYKATGWEVAHFLSALHTLFDDVPARREDFTVATGFCLFPLPFCHHRWVEKCKCSR